MHVSTQGIQEPDGRSINNLEEYKLKPISTEDLCGDLLQNLSDSMDEPNNLKPSSKKASCALAKLLILMLILVTCFPLLLYQFNTCPPFPSTPNAYITCNSTTHTYGSTCHLSCSHLHWSTSELTSTCMFRGVWSVQDLTCRPQVAAVVGQELNNTMDIYPSTGSRSHLPGLPIFGGKVENRQHKASCFFGHVEQLSNSRLHSAH